MNLGPILIGLPSTELDDPGRKLLCHAAVGGVVLFSRNFSNRGQLEKLVRLYPLEVTQALLDVPAVDLPMLHEEALMNAWCERLHTRLGKADATITLVLDPEHQTYCPCVELRIRGLTQQVLLSHSFFLSAEYRAISQMSQRLDGLLESGATVQRGDKTQAVDSFGEVVAWLLQESRRGVDIQRYKGLGEMNPGQLWETTMDPDVRRMLQVTVDDAIGADRMFTTLMGDQVEPRRKFIDENALSVVNLDI